MKIQPGVATGDQVQEIFNHAKKHNYALPAVNVTSSSTVNSVMESAARLNSPVIIQFSNGGAHFNAGKGLSNEGQKAAILGGVLQTYSCFGRSIWCNRDTSYGSLCKKTSSMD